MTTKQQEQLSRAIGLAQALSRSEQMPSAVQEIGRQIEELLLAARVEARKEKDVPSPDMYVGTTDQVGRFRGQPLPVLSALGDTSDPCPECDGVGKQSDYDQGMKSLVHDPVMALKRHHCWRCRGTGRAENKGSSLDADGSPVDPLTVKCPRCGQPKQALCVAGVVHGDFHPERVRAAQEEERS